jgi:hypothetical protein
MYRVKLRILINFHTFNKSDKVKIMSFNITLLEIFRWTAEKSRPRVNLSYLKNK